MLFNSYSFVFVFFPVLFIGYYLIAYFQKIPGKAAVMMKLWLILMSLWFFASFGWNCTGLFLISCAFNFLIYLLMEKFHKIRKAVFIFGIIGNLGLLLYFKYAGFFAGIIDQFTGSRTMSATVLLPLAISFYTFQQLSFLSEVYAGTITTCSLLDYAVYITFFPKILQGPIVRFDEMKPQFDHMSANRLQAESVYRGILLFTFGLSKKVLLADTLGKAVDYGYSNLTGLTQLDAVIVAVSYSFQLYFDFSGYCDMAQGVCCILGIRLPQNFNLPYRARNISDFWKRWHMTLTRFFTKYVYIPLGGNRKGALRMYCNVFLIFLLSGFWHGAGWTFLIWGAMHGILSVFTKLLRQLKIPQLPGKIGHVLAVFLTFVYVTAAWIFFRATSVAQACIMLQKIIGRPVLQITPALAKCFRMDEIWYVLKVTPVTDWKYSGVICMWLILIVSAVFSFGKNKAEDLALKSRISYRQAFLAGILMVWSILTFSNVSTFLYLNF